jgi:hypothetical protein
VVAATASAPVSGGGRLSPRLEPAGAAPASAPTIAASDASQATRFTLRDDIDGREQRLLIAEVQGLRRLVKPNPA